MLRQHCESTQSVFVVDWDLQQHRAHSSRGYREDSAVSDRCCFVRLGVAFGWIGLAIGRWSSPPVLASSVIVCRPCVEFWRLAAVLWSPCTMQISGTSCVTDWHVYTRHVFGADSVCPRPTSPHGAQNQTEARAFVAVSTASRNHVAGVSAAPRDSAKTRTADLIASVCEASTSHATVRLLGCLL